ncbi:MAG: hypothetical protein KDC65_17385 [Saprospiraceae bacterium]|nr:hypothetical protein [Saprospiraceae bacterium]
MRKQNTSFPRCFIRLACLCGLAVLLAQETLPAQDPDIADNERSAMEEYFRTSELDGETPVAGSRKKRVSVPAGARRIGCICMDESKSPARSIGACSGHGGVRYWLYRTREGDTVRIITGRHERHPHPLDSLERSALAPPKPSKNRQSASGAPAAPTVIVMPQPYGAMPASPQADRMDWSDAAGISAGGLFSYLILRLLSGWTDRHIPRLQHVLRDLLRHRKRQTAGKNRKGAGPTRL